MTTTDPFVPATSRFALTGFTFTPSRDDEPSPVGIRPYGMRRARPGRPGRAVPPWRYDDDRQLAVTEDGRALIDVVCGDPSADTTSTTDGEDGPSSEDWDND